VSKARDPMQREAVADATRPSRTLKILQQLRGEDPSDLMSGLDAEADPELQPPPVEVADPDLAPEAMLAPPRDVARLRSRAGAYRGSSPATRSR
jgi:hypothetical protein